MNDELTLREIVLVSSWLLGSVLHVLLLRMILRRKRWVRGEGLFAVLVTAVGLWNVGRFAFVFLHLLFKGTLPTWVPVVCDGVAYAGLLLIPSALLHTLGRLLVERLEQAPRAGPPADPGRQRRNHLASRFGIALVYVPVLVFPEVVARVLAHPGEPGFTQLGSVIRPFADWFVAALLASSLLSAFLARRAREPREARFYWSMVGILLGTGALLVAIYAVGMDSIGNAGFLLEGLIVLASTIPSLTFGYYVHRHHYMEFVVRRSIFYLVLIVGTVLTYVWGISSIAWFLDARVGLHHRLVEVSLIVSLVFVFPEFRRGLQRALTMIFYRESDIYRRVLSELIGQMGRGPAYRLSTLARHVAMTVARTLHVEQAAIVLFDGEGKTVLSTHRIPRPDIGATRALLLYPGAPAYVLVEDLGDDESELACGRELDALGAEAAFAVRAEGKLGGVFLVGSKASGQPLFQEEIELCRALADQLAVSLENLRLYEEKLALERKIHETEQKLTLGRFSASVAHRVKNPLSSIKAITQSMAEDMAPGDQRRADLEIVVGEVDRLTQVVNQLLDYADPSQAEPADSEFDLPEVLAEVALLYQHEAALFGTEIRIQCPASLPRAKGERVGAREVFANLIQNGIHAMPRGGVLAVGVLHPAPAPASPPIEPVEGVSGATAPVSGPSPAVAAPTTLPELALVEIADGGVGIAPEHLARVFAPFFTTKPRGTGLGLAIARHKVEELGGRIEAESPIPEGERPERASGPGTRFRVWWPVVYVPAPAPVVVKPAIASEPTPPEGDSAEPVRAAPL